MEFLVKPNVFQNRPPAAECSADLCPQNQHRAHLPAASPTASVPTSCLPVSVQGSGWSWASSESTHGQSER